jgi:hypothetical protein
VWVKLCGVLVIVLVLLISVTLSGGGHAPPGDHLNSGAASADEHLNAVDGPSTYRPQA